VKRAPFHAGKLPVWERLVFALVFAVMAALVIGITLSATKLGNYTTAGRAKPVAGRAETGKVQAVVAGGSATRGASPVTGRRASLDRRLAAALAPVLRTVTGHLAIGIIDTTTGAEAVYGGQRHFAAASIVKADILAVLLLQAQRQGSPLSDATAQLAVPMIENSADADASDLWNLAGAASGMAAANVTLGLSHTRMGQAGYWGLTSTTVVDQLRLLTDLTSARSPLTAASRDYELGLMENVEGDQQWGVSAAASPGTTFAIKDGWVPDPTLWVMNSIGVVRRDGQRLLIAVLCSGQPTEADGIAADEAAALAAARMITRPARS
jgi:hypothetical protein